MTAAILACATTPMFCVGAMLQEGCGRVSTRTSSSSTANCEATASQSKSSANLLHMRSVYAINGINPSRMTDIHAIFLFVGRSGSVAIRTNEE